MENIIDKLLAFDTNKIEIPTKNYTMKLKKLGGESFDFPLVAISPEILAEIKENMMDFNGKSMKVKIRAFEGQIRTIIEGCPTVFKNEEVIRKFNAKTPYELVTKILLGGEMEELADEIENLSGFENVVDDVKN